MIRRPPRSTLDRWSAASDVYKRQVVHGAPRAVLRRERAALLDARLGRRIEVGTAADAVSYTHLRAHETVLDLVCRLLLEKKKNMNLQYCICAKSRNCNISIPQQTLSPSATLTRHNTIMKRY